MNPNALSQQLSEDMNSEHQTFNGNDAPRGFSLDVIQPRKSQLGLSPLNDTFTAQANGGIFNSYSDSDKEMESTHYSNERKNEQSRDDDENLLSHQKSRKPIEINGVVIDKFMASDNLNECVDFILKKEKLENKMLYNKIIKHNSTSKCKGKKNR